LNRKVLKERKERPAVSRGFRNHPVFAVFAIFASFAVKCSG